MQLLECLDLGKLLFYEAIPHQRLLQGGVYLISWAFEELRD